MCALGIQTASHHLDVLENPPGPLEINWVGLQNWATAHNWNGANFPVFAGRYFLGGKYQWGHGEGRAAQNSAATLEWIAPIEFTDPVRQSSDGVAGLLYGGIDAGAICARLASCIVSGEMSVANAVVYVFLDVAAGTALKP